MEEYSFSGSTGKQYNIILDIGITLIKCGYNEDLKLYERFRQLEFFSSDITKQIIIKYKKELFTDIDYTIEVTIPNTNNEFTVITIDKPSKTIEIQTIDEEGNTITTEEIIPAVPKFSFWDTVLGIPLIRKFIVNAVLEDVGLTPFFDQNQLLNIDNN